jgi:glycolate oxidase FAD binding subunit
VAAVTTTKRLTDALGGDASVLEAKAAYTVDGLSPAAVVRPGSNEAVSRTLAIAHEENLAVIPLGGRQHAHIGNLPARYDLALDLSALDAVVEFEPADLTITVQAGMTLGKLRKLTAKAGLMIPFDPSAPDKATVGGMIAAAVSGPARHTLGTPRDFTIGLRVVTADGRLTRAGGKVVKNVAGYDLCKLYTGSLGTLGVIVEASLKAIPAPPVRREIRLPSMSAHDACTLVRSAVRVGLSVQSASTTRGAEGWTTDMTLSGTAAGVDRTLQELQERSAQPSIETKGPAPALEQRALEIMIAVLPSRLGGILTTCETTFPGADIEAWPASGICLVRTVPDEDAVSAAGQIAEDHSGRLTVRRCPTAIKEEIDVFGEDTQAIGLAQRIKSHFDPRTILSPGRGAGKI